MKRRPYRLKLGADVIPITYRGLAKVTRLTLCTREADGSRENLVRLARYVDFTQYVTVVICGCQR